MTALLPANRLVTDVVRQAELRKTLELVLDDPDSWNQDQWIKRTPCGTACCLAGTYVVRVLGGTPAFVRETEPITSMVTLDGRARYVVDEANEGLGLPNRHRLFDATNSLRRLVELAWLYTGGAVDLLDRYHALAADRDENWLAVERTTEVLQAANAYEDHAPWSVFP